MFKLTKMQDTHICPKGRSNYDFQQRIITNLDTASTKALNYLDLSFDTGSGFPSFIAPSGNFSKRKQSPPEIFSSLIISQCLVDIGIYPSFMDFIINHLNAVTNPSGFMHFFFDKTLLVADTDCTAVGHALLLSLNRPSPYLNLAIDKLIENTDPNGIIEVYQKPAGEHEGRIDANVLVNVLYLLHAVDRANEAALSERFVFQTLGRRTYLEGSRYYPSPDVFLYFLSRLVRDYPHTTSRYRGLLRKELVERKKISSTFLDISLRCAALDNIGLDASEYRDTIRRLQAHEGYWPAETFFKYGQTNRCFGGEALSTGFGIRALGAL